MYTPLNLLANYIEINQRRIHFRDRWQTTTGKKLTSSILKAIEDGGGEQLYDIINNGPRGFFKAKFEMRGFYLKQTVIDAPHGELFKNIILNYCRFRDTTIKRASFLGITGNFVDATRAVFERATFTGTSFYGANFEDCTFYRCNFLGRNSFSNCTFKNVEFKECFFETDIFLDCNFDELTRVTSKQKTSLSFDHLEDQTPIKFDNTYSSSFYHSLREAYEAGHVSHLARIYLFKEKQSLTRYNTTGKVYKSARYFLEFTTGYGIKPLRVLATAFIVFSIFTSVFVSAYGSGGFLLSAGGFFTFGANTGLLETFNPLLHALYVLEAFLGITCMSTFIVVMTNYWASLR